MRGLNYFIASMFLVLLLIASLVKIEIVVVGPGRLATVSPPILLQPLERAIVRELNVKEGDAVKKGQVLATLDPTFAEADLASLTIQQRSLISQIRRLEAELNDQPFEADMAVSAEDALQVNLYRGRRAQYESQLRVYNEEIERRRANIRTTEDERDSQAKQLVIAKDIEGMRSSMLEKQVGSRLNYLDAQSARMRIEQSLQSAGNRLSELRHDLQSKEAERQAFVDQWRHQVLDSLVAARNEAATIGEGVNKALLVKGLVVVIAPEDGVVLNVAKRSVGSILNQAESFITIIKSDAPLVAEVMINSSDIGYLRPGDEAVLKVDAYPYQRHGLMKGRLLSVSEESYSSGASSTRENGLQAPSMGGGGGAFHRGLVELVDTRLESQPAGARLIPGMTLAAEVKVGSRSVMSYFLSPITRGLRESIREP
ncbi:MAG: HlyD family type I secretion periplasmic adaptor subunit [Micropepsaceae bacterium]